MPRLLALPVLLTIALLTACGGEDANRGEGAMPGKHPALGDLQEAALDAAGKLESTPPATVARRMESMVRAASRAEPAARLTVDYPLDESVFPPEFVPPTFLWHDADPDADTWLVEIAFSDASAEPITVLVPGAPPPRGEIDLEAISEANEVYEGTEYQRSATSWSPSPALWTEIKRRSIEAPATVTFSGFATGDLETPRSRGGVRVTTSKDPVGAPFFYRDVPLMAAAGEHGRIKPLGEKAIPIIAWRLREVSREDSKLVLKGMASCGNCHSFSRDGKTLGMDVDGPDGDKGMYAIKAVSREMVIDTTDVITWNSFTEKPEGHRTLGFMSRVSPDGTVVVSTVNEALYVSNFMNWRMLQVFYPTRGILAYHARDDGTIRALPGADDPEYVHCSPAWSPDGRHLVFSRAWAFDPYPEGRPLAKYPNDPNEPQIQYDLVRIPFADGAGGTPVPVEGASSNGMSNTFPKVSPDGKWIVFTKCKNGLLMRPDGRLWIVPFEGGEAREMRCNTRYMNSWHSFSPNGRWLVFSSKSRTPYTQAFLTHIDEDGNDSPAILVPNCTAANRAVNLPEFLNAPFEALDRIEVPAVKHHVHTLTAQGHIKAGEFEKAAAALEMAIEEEPTFIRALVTLGFALMQLGRHEEALEHLERALAEDPRNPYALFNLGVSYVETGRPLLGIRSLEQLIEIVPTFPGTREHLRRARGLARVLQSAILEAERQVAWDEKNGEPHRRLAELYRSAGRLEEAVTHLDLAVNLGPEDPVSAATLALLLATCQDESIRDGERAVTLAERAVALTRGRQIETLLVLGAALAEVGRHDDAVRTTERALALARETSPGFVAAIEARLERHREKRPIRAVADR